MKGDKNAVNPNQVGTKVAPHYQLSIPAGESQTIELRLCDSDSLQNPFGDFAKVFTQRKQEADDFYQSVTPQKLSEGDRHVQRQAFAGMLWNKQFYCYVIKEWLEGDATQPKPPPQRKQGRNHEWMHLLNADIISMPDKWEYPWYASWDLAFHMIPFAMVDPELR